MKKILFLALSFTLGVLSVESFAQTNPSAGASGYNYLINGGIPSGAVGEGALIRVNAATSSGGGSLELKSGTGYSLNGGNIYIEANGAANSGGSVYITPGGSSSGTGKIYFGSVSNPDMSIQYGSIVTRGGIEVQNSIKGNALFLGGATTQPSSLNCKLGVIGNAYVEGKITATEVVVKTNVWADHVFSKEYELMSLPELEQFVNENSHLPGIPTQTEAIANGVNVSEMNVKLLQKVEELTLYVIELQKQVDALKTR